jgi:hypothetical protein
MVPGDAIAGLWVVLVDFAGFAEVAGTSVSILDEARHSARTDS